MAAAAAAAAALHGDVERLLAVRHDAPLYTRTAIERWLHAQLCELVLGPRTPAMEAATAAAAVAVAAAPTDLVTVLRPLRWGRGLAGPAVPCVLRAAEYTCGAGDGDADTRIMRAGFRTGQPLFEPREWADLVNPVRWRGSRVGTTWALATFVAALIAAKEARAAARPPHSFVPRSPEDTRPLELCIVAQSRRLACILNALVEQWIWVFSGSASQVVVVRRTDALLWTHHCRLAFCTADDFVGANAHGFAHMLYDGIDESWTLERLLEYTRLRHIPGHDRRIVGVQHDTWHGNADHVHAAAAVAARCPGATWQCGTPTCRHDAAAAASIVETAHVDGALVTRERRFDSADAGGWHDYATLLNHAHAAGGGVGALGGV